MSNSRAAAIISSACPYTNLSEARTYPWMLLSCNMEDFRVPYWGPAKYVAKLRHLRRAAAAVTPTLLNVENAGGHFTRSETADAEALAFLLAAVQPQSSAAGDVRGAAVE